MIKKVIASLVLTAIFPVSALAFSDSDWGQSTLNLHQPPVMGTDGSVKQQTTAPVVQQPPAQVVAPTMQQPRKIRVVQPKRVIKPKDSKGVVERIDAGSLVADLKQYMFDIDSDSIQNSVDKAVRQSRLKEDRNGAWKLSVSPTEKVRIFVENLPDSRGLVVQDIEAPVVLKLSGPKTVKKRVTIKASEEFRSYPKHFLRKLQTTVANFLADNIH